MRNATMPHRLLAVGFMAFASTSWASGLQVSPVGLAFAPTASAQALWLTNTGGTHLNAQVRLYLWTQTDGGDVLTPTDELVASPPMLSLAPGARQLVRVIRLDTTAPGGAEQAFRVVVDELPPTGQAPPQAATGSAPPTSGVQYILRYSIPVFVQAPGGPDAETNTLTWALVPQGDGLALQVHNAGTRHAQLSTVSLLSSDGAATTMTTGLLGYVLPGMTMRWPIHAPAAKLSRVTQVKVTLNGTPVEKPIAAGGAAR